MSGLSRSLLPALRLWADRRGNFAIYTALALIPIAFAVAASVDYASALSYRDRMQQMLDAAVLAGAGKTTGQAAAAADFFNANLPPAPEEDNRPAAKFTLGDGVLDGVATISYDHAIGSALLGGPIRIGVVSQARIKAPAGGPCITVLADKSQALLVNSGAKIAAPNCEVHVRSQQDPAFIMNAGSSLDIKRLCVKGTKYIRNGGTISNLETGCDAAADPYKDALAEPTVPGSCATSGAKDGTNHTLNPGLHCNVIFNGSPTITFKPGLHIIKGSMIINSGAKVVAEGVTFYFPDTDSQIQANGNLTMTATAPTSGTYKGVLMFEKTSSAANNANKRNYVFNGSSGEKLEGIVYLPNREVTYNSTTNIGASKFSLVVNSLIVNSANWSFSGLSGGGGDAEAIYLSR